MDRQEMASTQVLGHVGNREYCELYQIPKIVMDFYFETFLCNSDSNQTEDEPHTG